MSHARSEYKDFMSLTPDAYEAVLALGQVAAKAGMDKQLLELIKLRASQINGCAFCVQYHILQSEKLGVPADKLNLVVVWREAPQFSRARARGAGLDRSADLARRRRQRRGLCARRAREFSEKELAYLTSAIASINVWNRFGAAYRWTPPARQEGRRRGSFVTTRSSSRRLPGCLGRSDVLRQRVRHGGGRRDRCRSRGRGRGSAAHRTRSGWCRD